MARLSRIKKEETLQAEKAAAGERHYKTALYIRLSILDGGRDGSDTVKTQEVLLRKFIEGKPQFSLVDIYVDNGESGVSFKRNEFGRMMGDIKKGKVDCIIVKDLSRFGRNYIEAGEYLEEIFPLLGIRFIAVNDCYDSEASKAGDFWELHLRNLVNDIYARDISHKICPVLRAKQERGEFIGSWAAYGYLKSEKDKHKLAVDRETAPVVQKIFQWRLWGMSYGRIIGNLTRLEIPSPGRYRYEKGLNKDNKMAEALWKSAAVGRILANPVYLGHMVQGRRQAALWKGEVQRTMPEKQWIVAKNTHEAIVSEEDFKKVQEMRRRKE